MAFPTALTTISPTPKSAPTIEAFTYRDVVTALIKARGLHDGIWAIDITAGIQGLNTLAPNSTDVLPAMLVPILKIGLCRVDKESSIAVDASLVNPPVLLARA